MVMGPVAMAVWLMSPAPAGFTPEAHRFAGVFLLTIIWWVTEPIPIYVTGLLAVALASVVGVFPADWPAERITRTLFAPFANPSVFFLMGSLFIGRAMSRHGLDRRFALAILSSRWGGHSPNTILLGVGLATGLLSMFVSNVAATAMVFPITLGIIEVLGVSSGRSDFRNSKYASALLLMCGFASTVWGISTPIGTATNLVARGFFERRDYFDQPVVFGRWMMLGVPLSVVIFLGLFLWLRWGSDTGRLDLTKLRTFLADEQKKLGPWSRGEVNTLIVFVAVVSLWILSSVLGGLGFTEVRAWFTRHLPEAVVSICAPVLLYLLPINLRRQQFTLEAADFSRIDWGTLLLFGSGLSLGNLMNETHLAEALGAAGFAALGTNQVWVITLAATVAAVVLSEFSSNTATAATLIPIIHALCLQSGVDPLPPLVGVAFGASFGSALPVSTPPNAVVYGSGILPVRRMISSGVALDAIATLAVLAGLAVVFSLGWSPFSPQ
jgi:sodium-dependent dicarboxylate transporter 2/3/5